MIDIKTISGEQLMAVPILKDAVIREELMVSDYIMLSWSSDMGEILPVGTYIEYEGERYSLIEPYVPNMVSEIEYRYTPKFYSRESAWNKQPACVYTYEDDGVTVKSREFDWTFVGSPADAMQIVRQAIRNETGEEWDVALSDSLPASIEITAQAASIQSMLATIADLCGTEYWTTKEDNTIHLSKCERGEPMILEVGVNVNVPSVMAGNAEYYTRYYALGSTRNITQSAGNINGSINRRLTLDPEAYPGGYKDVKGHMVNGVFVSDLEQGEIFSKIVIFDDIYPSSDLEISDVRPRMKYRLDGDGKKIKVGGTDENPVYDQYAIWYFKIKDFAFTKDLLIEGLPLSIHFKSGRLAGQEFELIYHDRLKTERTGGDVVPFTVEAGDYEIKFKESSGAIIPDFAYIIPQNGDKITLFNIELPSEYTASAQNRLLEALNKEIEKDHKDSNSYEMESNPVAFYESDTDVSVGQRVSFVYGGKTLATRVLMVERHLDYPCQQKIRVGNNTIKGSTKELRDNVESLNKNVDVLSAFNSLSQSIQDSYGRTQQLINESIAEVIGIWTLDDEGNLVTEKQVVIKNSLIIHGDMASGGEGEDTPVEGASEVVIDGMRYPAKDGVIDLTEAFANVEVDLSEYYTKNEVNELIDEVKAGDIDLANYYTKSEVDAKIPKKLSALENDLNLGSFAYKNALAVSDIPDLSGKYLPLSGGILKGSNPYHQYILTLNTDNAYYTILRFQSGGVDKGRLQWANDAPHFRGFGLINDTTGDRLGLSDSGTPFYNDKTLLHSGNVGSYKAGSSKALSDYFNTRIDSANVEKFGDGGVRKFIVSSSMVEGKPPHDGSVLHFSWDSMLGFEHQLFISNAGNSSTNERMAWRAQTDGTWSNWKTIAFTDSNVASATKLATARTIWGQSFDGTGNVSGSVKHTNGWSFIDPSDGYVIFGYDYAHNNKPIYIDGKEIYLRYGTSHTTGLILNSSGNVTIGGSDLAGTNTKLYVEGRMIVKNEIILYQSNSLARLTHYVTGNIGRVYTYDDESANYCDTYIGRNDGKSIVAKANGNVLIGTTTDSGYKLDVAGTGRFTGTIYTSNALLCKVDNVDTAFFGSAEKGLGSASGASGALVYAYGARDILFYTNAAERMKIASGGNVSIAKNLAVAGKVSASGGIDIPNGQQLAFLDASGNRHTIAWDSASNGILIDGNLIVLGELATGLPMQEIPSIPEVGA